MGEYFLIGKNSFSVFNLRAPGPTYFRQRAPFLRGKFSRGVTTERYAGTTLFSIRSLAVRSYQDDSGVVG